MVLLIGNVIEQEFTVTSDWNLGSGLSLVLMVFILISMALLSKIRSRRRGGRVLMGKFVKRFYLVIMFIFLYAPILVLMVLSFNSSKYMCQMDRLQFKMVSADVLPVT